MDGVQAIEPIKWLQRLAFLVLYENECDGLVATFVVPWQLQHTCLSIKLINFQLFILRNKIFLRFNIFLHKDFLFEFFEKSNISEINMINIEIPKVIGYQNVSLQGSLDWRHYNKPWFLIQQHHGGTDYKIKFITLQRLTNLILISMKTRYVYYDQPKMFILLH